MNIFQSLPSGDSARWDDTAFAMNGSQYDAGNYTLTYIITGPVAPLSLTAVANGSGWRTTLTAAQSAALVPGRYWWTAILTKSGERITAGSGELVITPNLAAVVAPYDGSTQAEKDLAAVEAAISARISGGAVSEYTIGSRTLKREAMATLLEMRSALILRVRNERAAADIANGLGNPRNLYARFR